jgi:hypothetical protein
MATSEDEYIDPFEAHFRRDPLPGAAVLVVVIAPPGDAPEQADEVGRSLVELLGRHGHPAEAEVVEGREGGKAAMLELAHREDGPPLVLVTRASKPWTDAHLAPLLKAIDHCDHVVGRRPLGTLAALLRWVAGASWRWVLAVPVYDVYSPCRLHRSEKLKAIPLQSDSDFADVELLAKATFLGHLIDEVKVPPLAAPRPRRAWADVFGVLVRPRFVETPEEPEPSGPAEQAEGEQEGDDRPGGEDQHGGAGVEPAGALQDHGPKGVEQLRQGEGLDERLGGVGEPLGREEHA